MFAPGSSDIFALPLSVNNVGMLPNLLPSHFLDTADDIQVGLGPFWGFLSLGPGWPGWVVTRVREECMVDGGAGILYCTWMPVALPFLHLSTCMKSRQGRCSS